MESSPIALTSHSVGQTPHNVCTCRGGHDQLSCKQRVHQAGLRDCYVLSRPWAAAQAQLRS
eukprot:1765084-Amphidinium_carterae.1